jgi:predicted Zn-dependent peptidase
VTRSTPRLACLALALAAAPLSARATPSPSADTGLQARTLRDGLQVLTLRDPRYDVVRLVLTFPAGLVDAPEGLGELPHVAEHAWFRAAALDGGLHPFHAMGCEYNGHVVEDMTILWAQCPSDRLDDAVRTLRGALARTWTVPTGVPFDTERQIVTREWCLRSGACEGPSHLEALPLPGGALGADTDYHTIPRVAPEHVDRWVRERWVPDEATLVVHGGFDPAALDAVLDVSGALPTALSRLGGVETDAWQRRTARSWDPIRPHCVRTGDEGGVPTIACPEHTEAGLPPLLRLGADVLGVEHALSLSMEGTRDRREVRQERHYPVLATTETRTLDNGLTVTVLDTPPGTDRDASQHAAVLVRAPVGYDPRLALTLMRTLANGVGLLREEGGPWEWLADGHPAGWVGDHIWAQAPEAVRHVREVTRQVTTWSPEGLELRAGPWTPSPLPRAVELALWRGLVGEAPDAGAPTLSPPVAAHVLHALTNPANINVVLVGTEATALADRLSPYLARLRARPNVLPPVPAELPAWRGSGGTFLAPEDSSSGVVVLSACPLAPMPPDEAEAGARVLQELLLSRYYRDLRGALGQTYDPAVTVEPQWGRWMVRLDATTDARGIDVARDAARRVLASLSEGVGEEELAAATGAVRGRYRRALASTAAHAELLVDLAGTARTPDDLFALDEAVGKVSHLTIARLVEPCAAQLTHVVWGSDDSVALWANAQPPESAPQVVEAPPDAY